MRKFILLIMIMLPLCYLGIKDNVATGKAANNGISTAETSAERNIAPMQMKFHCEKDTAEINELLKAGIESGKKTPNELVMLYGQKLIGTPYVAHTLEGKEEMLTINIDQLDCTTFIETLYALTRTTLDGRFSWRDFANNLENIRYQNGEMNGYSSRLHYFSEWVVDNFHRGNVSELTSSIPGSKDIIKTLDFMSGHRNLYPALKDSVEFEKIKSVEAGYTMHKFYYVKKEWLNSKETKDAIEDGDIAGLVTKKEGLDVSHLGILMKKDDTLYLLNASSIDGKVEISKETLSYMLKRSRNALGIRVIRINK
jgi:hypothetical protein